MKGKTASFIFIGVCLILAILLITKSISITLSSGIFALALILLGSISGGFKKK